MTKGEIVHDFPESTPENIRACLTFAAEREKRIATLGVPWGAPPKVIWRRIGNAAPLPAA